MSALNKSEVFSALSKKDSIKSRDSRKSPFSLSIFLKNSHKKKILFSAISLTVFLSLTLTEIFSFSETYVSIAADTFSSIFL